MEVWWWKIKRNHLLYTYPAVAGYLQRGNVVVEKRLKGSFLTCWTYGRSGTRVMTLLMYIKCI